MDKINDHMVWLLVTITGGNYRDNREKVFDLKRRDERIRVHPTDRDQPDTSLDVLIFKEEGKKLL